MYDDPEGKEIAEIFRALDARKGRMPGLLNLKSLINRYHSGEMATRWHAAADEMIAEERAAEARRLRRRIAYAKKKAPM
jgi:hypothetical protein